MTEMIFSKEITVEDYAVDRYGRMKSSMILYCVQEMAGGHCARLGLDWEAMAKRGLFWAVTRHKVEVSRLPARGERIRLETWPMPTTRVAYPRATVICDLQGNVLVCCVSLWVLMELSSRAMVLPGKSGITVNGITRGSEPILPGSLIPEPLELSRSRCVCFTDLDRNGHMNNTRYLDWVDDLLPGAFHHGHSLRQMTVYYSSEAREGQLLEQHWGHTDDGVQVDIRREKTDEPGKFERVFAAKLLF